MTQTTSRKEENRYLLKLLREEKPLKNINTYKINVRVEQKESKETTTNVIHTYINFLFFCYYSMLSFVNSP